MRNEFSSYLSGGLALLAVGALSMPQHASAQIPKEFTNLQVLHKQISRPELISMMKGFTRALGVRCEFCHVGEPDQPLSTFDFPSDDKPTKRTARLMLRMVADINESHLSHVHEGEGLAPEIHCATCHRGQSKPRTIDDTLTVLFEGGGVDALLSGYRDLRAEHYGGGSYDFGEDVLKMWAVDLAKSGSMDDAMSILRTDEEFYPESDNIQFSMGFLALQGGDTATAKSRIENALKLNPNNIVAKNQLDQLK